MASSRGRDGRRGRVDGMARGAGEPSAKRAKVDEADEKEEEDPLVRRKEEVVRLLEESSAKGNELSADEKAQPGFIGKILTLESIWKNDEGHIVDTTRCVYEKSKGFFTVAEVVASVEAYERIDRPKTKWFGGVDCHHVFFEGLFPNANKDAYGIFWGS